MIVTRQLLGADLDTAARALSEAFADDPVIAWLTGGTDPADVAARALPGFFSVSVRAGLLRGSSRVAVADGQVVGAALWNPPDVEFFGDAQITDLVAGATEAFAPGGMDRMMALGAMVSERHPDDRPHFYLSNIGVMATARSGGVGAQLVTPLLDRLDADGIGAYLESSNPRNLSFYERLGFTELWTDSPAGGPPMTGMWRDPR